MGISDTEKNGSFLIIKSILRNLRVVCLVFQLRSWISALSYIYSSPPSFKGCMEADVFRMMHEAQTCGKELGYHRKYRHNTPCPYGNKREALPRSSKDTCLPCIGKGLFDIRWSSSQVNSQQHIKESDPTSYITNSRHTNVG